MLKFRINKTLIYLLIFTVATSAIAYNLVVRAYDDAFNIGYLSAGM